MKFKLKYYVINLQNESDLKEFGIEVKEGKAGTLTLTNPLQKEEIDWAGFVPIEEAKKRIAKYQLPIIDKYERGNVMESGGQADDKIDMRIRELKYNIKEANFVINSVLSQEGRHSRVSRMYVKFKKKDIAELKKIYIEHPEKKIPEFNKGGQVKFSKNEYEKIKHLIQNGDIILYKAKGFTSRMIRMFGQTDFDHSAIIRISGKKIENIELDTAGFSITPLKDEIKDTQFFVILRPKNTNDKKITNAIKQTIHQFKNKKFSYKKILKIALTELRLKKYKDINGINNDTPTAICTELVNYYLGLVGIKDFNEMQYILPEDFLASKKLVNIKKHDGGEIKQTMELKKIIKKAWLPELNEKNKIIKSDMPFFDLYDIKKNVWVYHSTKEYDKIIKEGFKKGTKITPTGAINDNSENPNIIHGYMENMSPEFSDTTGVAVKVKKAFVVFNNFDKAEQVLFSPQDVIKIIQVDNFNDFVKKIQKLNIIFFYGGEIDYEDFDDWIFNKKVLETKLKMFVKLLK